MQVPSVKDTYFQHKVLTRILISRRLRRRSILVNVGLPYLFDESSSGSHE